MKKPHKPFLAHLLVSSLTVFSLLVSATVFATDGCPGGRTQTPGGWGAPANGNNPGTYRDAHFDDAFPEGIVLGCGANTMTFTTASAIEIYLPCGGSSSAISGSFVNPTCSGNNLVNHLLAATLSVGFDAFDPNFGSSDYALADLIFAGGTFEGWSVSEVIALANEVLGGCNTEYTPTEIKSALASLNENYVDGNSNNGNFDCPDEDPCLGDNENPYVIFELDNLEVLCGESYELVQPLFEDALDTDLSIVYSETTEGTDCDYTIIRTWLVTDDCDNTLVYSQTVHVLDTTPPIFDWTPEDLIVECGEDLPIVDLTSTDNCDEQTEVTYSDEILPLDCTYQVIRTWYTIDNCGNSESIVQVCTYIDTTAPILIDAPNSVVLDCDEELPSVPNVSAMDSCDGPVDVFFTELEGSGEEEQGVVLDCDLITPVDALTDPTWSLVLFNLGGQDYHYTTLNAHLTVFEGDESGQDAAIEATLVSIDNPNAGWVLNLQLESGVNWMTWDNMPWATNYKDDFNLAGSNYLDWIYFLISSSSTLTGWGDYEGSFLTIAHLPSNYYYGYQMGVAANNVNDNYGNGGWISVAGTFVDSSQGINTSVALASGDIAFDQQCCNRPSVTRTWTAEDCSGNTTTYTQTISFTELLVDGGQEQLSIPSTSISFESIYPNPSSGDLTVIVSTTKNTNVKLIMTNSTLSNSKNIYSGPLVAGQPLTIPVNAGNLPSGVYSMNMKSVSGEHISKIVVIH